MPKSTIICETCHLAHPPADGPPPLTPPGDYHRAVAEAKLQACITAQAAAMEWLLSHVGKKGTCDGPNCGAPIWFVIHSNGKRTPYTPAGLNHFVDCPDRERFQRAAKG